MVISSTTGSFSLRSLFPSILFLFHLFDVFLFLVKQWLVEIPCCLLWLFGLDLVGWVGMGGWLVEHDSYSLSLYG